LIKSQNNKLEFNFYIRLEIEKCGATMKSQMKMLWGFVSLKGVKYNIMHIFKD